MKRGPLLGAHVSISDGFDKAPLRGKAAGCLAIQVFVKSSRDWRIRPLRRGEAEAFRQNLPVCGIAQALAHGSYLINLGAPDPAFRKKSVEALRRELLRAQALGIPSLIVHPGSHLGTGEEEGLKRIAEGLDLVLEKTEGLPVKILLENTAGQGTALGYRFDHLALLFERVEHRDRLGVCLDTCHLFAAGYELRTEEGYRRTMEAFDRIVGLPHLEALHLNDSKRGLGSRVDRHEHIGKGWLGLRSFRFLMKDKRLIGLPMIIETPKDGDPLASDRRNLAILRRLRRSGVDPRRSGRA